VQVEGQQRRVGLVVEQRRVGEGAGRDDARHRALHRPLGGARVAHLLGNHHRFAQLDEPRQVLLDRVVRHPGHLDRLAGGRAAGGQRDVHQPRGLLGVLEEQLVEVAHAVEEEGVGVVLLDAQVLLHHRGVLRDRVTRKVLFRLLLRFQVAGPAEFWL
jgi:hypothetical protein